MRCYYLNFLGCMDEQQFGSPSEQMSDHLFR